MVNWSTTTKHEPSSINNGRRYELRDRVSIEQLNNMTENSFYAMEASSVAKEKAEEALKFAQGSGTTVYENGSPVADFNADKKANVTDFENYYTKEQVDDLVSTGGSIDVDLSNYYTKDETYSKQEIDDKLANLEVDIDFSDYYTKTETDGIISTLNKSINDLETNKADKSEIPNVDNAMSEILNSAKSYTDTKVAELIDSAPETLDTFKEIADAFAENQEVLDTLNSAIANKQNTISDLDTIRSNASAGKSASDTIAGYGDIVDYNKQEVVNEAKTKYKKVPALPSSAEVEDNTIYLLQHTESGFTYWTEHIYIDGFWEQFGSNADVDIVGILDNTTKIATRLGGFSAGLNADVTTTGGAIGRSALAGNGGAIGENSRTSNGFAGGYNAQTLKKIDENTTSTSDAIQLGTGTNYKEKSLQVYGDNIYDANTHTLTVENIALSGELLDSSSSFMPVGAIFSSAIPQTDARVHLLNGSTIPQTGVYAGFATLLKTLVSSGYNISCSQTQFDADVSTYGQCGKFVIDDTAGTIRLPIITEFVAGLTDLTNIGMAQLDMFKSHYHNIKTEGGNPPNGVVNPCASVFGGNQVTSNPNPIESTGGSETRPKNIRYPYYIVLASGYKSSQAIDIDNVVSDVNNIKNELNEKTRDYIVKSEPTSTGWFIKWASGLKEYWGVSPQAVTHNISFPEAFASTDYAISFSPLTNNTSTDILAGKVDNTVSYVKITMSYRSTSAQGTANIAISYYAKGF